ncbi:hypothetical protein GGS21DRAFT_296751 [Xylaria nigripes]|nr:hypothetical protein GGS21DRAFT_296751 [Xylaria nigripes]
MTGSELGKKQRPRLSIQTKDAHVPGSRSRDFCDFDPKSPTAFNTLSNVYITAIDRSTPATQSTPITAMKLRQPLKLRTDPDTLQNRQQVVQKPCVGIPGTPSSSNPVSPSQQMDIVYPSTMTATPPISAGVVESGRKIFTFSSVDINHQPAQLSPTAQARRRISFADIRAPYSHNRSLHSILRNSPLQSASARSPSSPRKQSFRIKEKVERRVGYDSPLTQTITTEKYTKSHIDLFFEDASPYSPSPILEDSEMMLDLAMAYTSEETRDGDIMSRSEEKKRRAMNVAAKTLVPSSRLDGIRKRKVKDRKRKWVWTIGIEDDESEGVTFGALRAKTGEISTLEATVPEFVVESPDAMTTIMINVEEAESGPALTEIHENGPKYEISASLASGAATPRSMDLGEKTPTLGHGTMLSESPLTKEQSVSADFTGSQTGAC